MTTNTLSLLERCKHLALSSFEPELARDILAAITAERSVSEANPYEQAVDDELVNSFLGTKEDFKDAKSALLAIIDWNCKVALDPAVSPEALALTQQAKPSQVNSQEPDFYIYPQHLSQLKLCDTLLCELSTVKMEGATACYTSPQAREPMSDEDVSGLWIWSASREAELTATTQQHAFARAIEAHHGIK